MLPDKERHRSIFLRCVCAWNHHALLDIAESLFMALQTTPPGLAPTPPLFVSFLFCLLDLYEGDGVSSEASPGDLGRYPPTAKKTITKSVY
jgi:hypothetical protein